MIVKKIDNNNKETNIKNIKIYNETAKVCNCYRLRYKSESREIYENVRK